MTRPSAIGVSLAAAIVLSGCGGGSGASIGGTLSGLASGASVVLQDNGGDSLTVAANGSFAFKTELDGDSIYAVTILTQPVGQACTLLNGSGSVDSTGDAVSSVAVSCVDTASLAGTVSGLDPGTAVTLSDGTILLPVAANGPFAFPGLLPVAARYAVTVVTQPVGETCAVANGSGTVVGMTATPITVTCS